MIDLLFRILTPFIKFWGKLHFPFTHKKITGIHYYKWRESIEIGTVFLTKTNGELSNLINPTEIKHAGIYIGKIDHTDIRYVAEATGKGAVLTDLVTFLTTKDLVIGCKPTFIRDYDKFKYAIQDAALGFKDIEYDYMFKIGNKNLYCFELVAECFKCVFPYINLKCNNIAKAKKIYDENTFLDEEFFEVIIDSRIEDEN